MTKARGGLRPAWDQDTRLTATEANHLRLIQPQISLQCGPLQCGPLQCGHMYNTWNDQRRSFYKNGMD